MPFKHRNLLLMVTKTQTSNKNNLMDIINRSVFQETRGK